MPLFIPHKALIEGMWYGGMTSKEIDDHLYGYGYSGYDPEVYDTILNPLIEAGWEKDHKKNRRIYNKNQEIVMGADLISMHADEDFFGRYYRPGVMEEMVIYMVGAGKRPRPALGSAKSLKIFLTNKLRCFVEISILVGMPPESIRHYMNVLEPKYGIWSVQNIIVYGNIFWNAGRVALRDSNIRNSDIRNYLIRNEDNPNYVEYLRFLGATEDDLLVHFGLADYNVIQRNNKSLHGRIGEKIIDNVDNRSMRLLSSDIIKLYMHIDNNIHDAESADKGTEEYRRELKRVFERIDYIRDDYANIDELNNMVIDTTDDIEVDEPFMAEEG